jgi:hypothetical protein
VQASPKCGHDGGRVLVAELLAMGLQRRQRTTKLGDLLCRLREGGVRHRRDEEMMILVVVTRQEG